MTSIAERKKNRAAQKARIAEKLASVGKSKYQKDENSWYPQLDADKNGIAVIRFLPEVGEMDLPWAEVYRHGFQGKSGKWYIHQCKTTIDGDCPVCKHNQEHWDDFDKKTQDARKRQHHFYSNVLVIKDPANPENEGQVKIFRYGAQIFNILQDAGQEDPLDEEKRIVDAFDPWDGSNFKLRVGLDERKYVSYLKSEFQDAKEIGTDAEIDEVLNRAFDLQEMYLDEKNFPDDEKAQKQFDTVVGSTTRLPSGGKTESAPSSGGTSEPASTQTEEFKPTSSLNDVDALFEDEG